MGLAYILLGITFAISLIGASRFNKEKYWWRSGETKFTVFMSWFTIFLSIFSLLYIIAQIFGWVYYTKTETVSYDVKIVSLQDGSQINGQFSGSHFVMRGNINQVEYFQYYKDNQNGSFSLDKKEADRSIIIPDATSETAYVKIIDEITSYKPPKDSGWWLMPSNRSNTGIYVHGEFHVPANSIQNNFVLDAK